MFYKTESQQRALLLFWKQFPPFRRVFADNAAKEDTKNKEAAESTSHIPRGDIETHTKKIFFIFGAGELSTTDFISFCFSFSHFHNI